MKHPTSSAQDREVRNNNRRRNPSTHHSQHDTQSSNPQRSKAGQQRRNDHNNTRFNHNTTPQTRQHDPTTPWMQSVPLGNDMYSSAEHRLHQEIVAYAAYCSPTRGEQNIVETIRTCIRRVVDGRFRRASVNVFGSFSTGLSLPSSDIDVAIEVPNLPESGVKGCLFQIASRLRTAGVAETTFVHHRARAPIIAAKTTEAYGSFEMDIGINNPVGVEAIDVVKTYISTMPALRPLVLVIKGLLAQKKMNDPSKGGLGSYPLIIMTIFFLKLDPYNLASGDLTGPNSLGILLLHFLKYYGKDFPYTKSYIMISNTVQLHDKAETSESLSVLCLIKTENEVSKAVTKFRPFADIFQEAYGSLYQATSQEYTGRQSLLGKIVTFDEEVLHRREMIDANFTPQPLPPPPRPPRQYPQHQPVPGPSLLARMGMAPMDQGYGYAPPEQYFPQQKNRYGDGAGPWSYEQPYGQWGHEGYYNQQSRYGRYGRY